MSEAVVDLGTAGYALPDEERGARETYPQLVARLSRLSVTKHFDAYADIEWERPDLQIDPADPRWELDSDEGLGMTAWYRALPQPVRARLGLQQIATFMKIGVQFENLLTRGLLEFALRQPGGAPEFRYAYHEAIEECQHSLMFQEFVNRTGLAIEGMPRILAVLGRRVAGMGRWFPSLFFVFVLGGEDPIDFVQRTALRSGRDIHPLLRRVCQIHITEEARHLCFARAYLREHVPKLTGAQRLRLAVTTPVVLRIMAHLMMRPSSQIVREYQIPAAVIREAYTDNPRHRAKTIDALGKIRTLWSELGLDKPAPARLLWSGLGLQ